ncbi:hypothetical protein [Parasporobacterium paucivorans]|uniref:FlgN protein n=1 Tax=Parasporobacterium paucivorans DSM 15970 TaxID=1122934 RepID=A0A1M6GEG8_9FIRM|nr:hypothetical protein [Parasporobacterium paucivorans]SHJ08344.1 hypothetical protein SAMN02745691_01304 [Parasporobacterium paucivorans DSM 15970]
MEYSEILLGIIRLLQRKYNIISEILGLTKELGEAISRNDQVSIQMVLEMRKEEMDKADACDKAISLMTNCLPREEGDLVRSCLKPDAPDGIQKNDYRKIIEISENIHSVIARCVEIDKVMNRRVAGAASYYTD